MCAVERLRFDHHLTRAQLRGAEMIVKLRPQERHARFVEKMAVSCAPHPPRKACTTPLP